MTGEPFSAQVRHQTGATIIDLHGDINSFADQPLNQAYAEAEAQNPTGTTVPATLVLNFTDVGYINSTGIALIVGLLAQARKARRRLVVYGLSDHYVEIFQITRLADFMTIYSDEAAALQETH